MTENQLSIFNINNESKMNGPGKRAVVWTQGCSIQCPGCFNPESHSFSSTTMINPVELGLQLGQLNVDGLTISGGEPLDQPKAVLELIKGFRKHNNGTVFMFTGYSSSVIFKSQEKKEVIIHCDAILAGPFVSSNKELWSHKQLLVITGRISPEELLPYKAMEISYHDDSGIFITGYPSLFEDHHVKKLIAGVHQRDN